MSVLDGDSKAPLPSMSWNSVVPEASERQPGHDAPDREPGSESTAGDNPDAAPSAGFATDSPAETPSTHDTTLASFSAHGDTADDRTSSGDPSGPISLGTPVVERVTLDVAPPSVLSAGAPPLGLDLDLSYAPRSDAEQWPVPAPMFDRPAGPASNPATSALSAPPPAPPSTPAVTTPAATTFSPVMIDVPRVTPLSAPQQGDVPPIVEATPVAPLPDHGVASAHSGEMRAVQAHGAQPAAMTTGEMPATASPAVAPTPSVPSVPAAASPAISLPAQVAAAHMATSSSYGAMPPAQRAPQRRSSGGSGFGLVLALVVLAGLIAAGIVFGRPYLFPDEWDESAKAYAEDIEAIRGVDFVEPLLIVSEPTAEYRARVGDELLGTWEQSLPMWRSFGLAAGGTDREVLDSLIEARSPARYSRADGQVYHDAAVRPAELDALLTREMAIAALDQDFRFSSRMARRTMLDAAMTEAHVLQQANVIQSQSAAPEPIRPTDDSPLAFLPPVLDYQLTAPTVFAELLSGFDDVATNPLDGIEAGGPGPLSSVPLAEAREALPLTGESVVGSPRSMDREFWYLVFAAYHEPSVARRMTGNLSAASLTEFESGERSCFAATFEAVSIDVLPLLAGDLAGWATAASPALGATTGSVSQTTVELRTCDPGDTFTPTARFGIARDLISWQAADLAVASAVTASGGDQAAVDEALGRLAQSGSALQVVALDPTVTATEMARVARVAAEPILAEAIVSGTDDVDG